MKFVSTLLKKFNKSSSSKTPRSIASSSETIWNHNENFQKTNKEEKNIGESRRPLRRQNRFHGLDNDVLAFQNSVEKNNSKVERQEVSEKKTPTFRRLQKQRRITESYRRKIAEMKKLQQQSIIDN